jgi:triphosphatase
MGTETELKLVCAPEVLARIGRHPAVRAVKSGRARTERLVSRYFDTPEGALRSAGLALRIRRTARGWEQTLKGEGEGVAGLQERPEWNWPVGGDAVAGELLAETPAAKILGGRKALALALQRLVPVFESDFSRTTHPLQFPDGTRAELCVDSGEVRAGGRTAPVCEAEIELIPGLASAPDGVRAQSMRLYDLPMALLDTLPVRLGYLSKAERASGLLARARAHPVKAEPVGLAEGMTQAAAFRAIATACMAQLQANEAGMLAGRDPEYLHQMRVALRRLRSAFAVFRERIPAERLALVEDEARALGRRLGSARDWDVLCTESLRAIVRSFPDEPGIAAIARRAARERAAHGRDARAAVSDPGYTRGLLRLAQMLAAVDEFIDHRAEPLPAFAATILQHRHRRLCHLGARLAGLSAEELHDLRIRAKKLRYAAEFFGSLFPGRRARAYAKALSGLQDVLGGLNDMATATRLLGELAITPAASKQRGAESVAKTEGILRGWLASCSDRSRSELPRAWLAFREQPRFWKKALPLQPPVDEGEGSEGQSTPP